MEHVATAARAQTAATGAQLQRMTLRAVTTVPTTAAPSSSSSMTAPITNAYSMVPTADASVEVQPSATTFTPATAASATTFGQTSSSPDDELPEGEPQRGVGQTESVHRSINDFAVVDNVDVDDDDEDVDDVEITRGSSGANTPTNESRTRKISSSGKISPSSRFPVRESTVSQAHDNANNDSNNSNNSNDTSDLLLGLSEDDSLYFTEG